MKALSIKQPWSSLIAHGIKDIENRTWKTNFRGRIYIHSTATFTKKQQKIRTNLFFSHKIDLRHPSSYPVSAIIGEVDIVDCVIGHKSVWADHSKSEKPIYNWVLKNAILYDKPILNIKGALSLWTPNKEQQLLIDQQNN